MRLVKCRVVLDGGQVHFFFEGNLQVAEGALEKGGEGKGWREGEREGRKVRSACQSTQFF